MPYNTAVAGTTITASAWNASVRDQTITPFASATARDSAITSPLEGMMAYLSDRDCFTAYNGTAWVDIAQLGAWDTTYTPTLTQSVAVTKTVTVARYTRVGKTITGSVSLAITSSGTAANPILFGVPVTARTSGLIIGSGYVYDTSANLVFGGPVGLSSTSVAGIYLGAGTVNNYVGASGMTAAVASGDNLVAQFTYEAA